MTKLKDLFNKVQYKLKGYFGFLYLQLNKDKKQDIIDQFHTLYYESHLLGKTWSDTRFLGVPAQKCPFDLFVYQEIIFDLKPDLIVECGTAGGGGALFMASICELMKHGEVVTIDIVDVGNRPVHPRIKYLMGSSISDDIVAQIKDLTKGKEKVLIILDSDHSKSHVLKELLIYSDLVTAGSYLIVEDTNVNGHPVQPYHGPGPHEAVEEFLQSNDSFVVDSSREKHYLSFNPGGYLKKVK